MPIDVQKYEDAIEKGASVVRLIAGLVSTVEKLFSKEWSGEQKHAAVKSQAMLAYKVGKDLDLVKDDDAEALGKIFDVTIKEVVKLNNELSLWDKITNFFGWGRNDGVDLTPAPTVNVPPASSPTSNTDPDSPNFGQPE